MPIITANQLIGKTLKINKAAPFYRVNDINNLGDKARPVDNMLPAGYQFVVDSFLVKGPAYTDMYGLLKAKRSDDYITFFGRDRQFYAIKTKSLSVGKKGFEQAGVKTVEQEQREKEEAEKTMFDKLFEGFGKFGKTAKWVLIGVAAVWATGYIIKSTKK